MIEHHIRQIEADGYTIVPDAIDPDLISELHETVERLEADLGARPAMNPFEGDRTVRIYNLLALGPVFSRIPAHPSVIPIIDAVLGAECLISSLASIAIDPGQSAQPIHADDQIIPIAKPHAAVVCNSMWALTDFTEENGATRLVPGSHLAPNPDYGGDYETIAAEMKKGSVLIWHGSLWHGGGANRSQGRRTGIAMNYCAGYIRQQENQQLGLSPDLVRGFEPRLQELVGYGVYRGLIGQIEKQSPAQRLLGAGDFTMMWDREQLAAERLAAPG
ncbi:MAG: phytanoyl-CoA dioxygenase family protein [Caulobacter sp.]|nr:phytanoyl-CoA dioxygenase family protein [Caulobacter sp.]